MNVVLVDMYMILQKEIRTTESLPEQHLRISPMTGYARSAAPARRTSPRLTDIAPANQSDIYHDIGKAISGLVRISGHLRRLFLCISLYISQSEQLFENADRLVTRKACVRD